MSIATAIIADDHAMIRKGLRDVLESENVSVVAEAADGLQAVALIRSYQPTLLMLDIAMPYARGIEVFGEARRWSPETKIVVFSGMTSTGLIAELDRAGANGIFLKREDLTSFTEAIPRILGGERVYGPGVRPLLDQSVETDALTQREHEILSLVAQGLGNREIAERLGVSAKTIDNHRTNLMRKLGVHSLAELLAYALREGLLDFNKEA